MRQVPLVIEREGGAVEDPLVLPAHGVEPGQRQPRLDDARDGRVHADIAGVAAKGRGRGDEEHLGARLRQALGHLLIRDVGADRQPQADPPAKRNRPRQRPR